MPTSSPKVERARSKCSWREAIEHMDSRWFFSGGALILLILHLSRPGLFDEKALAFLAAAALPWLGTFLRSFKLFGLEAELRDIRQSVEDAKKTSLDTAQRFDLETRATTTTPQAAPTDKSAEEIFEIAREYVSVRGRMTSGSDRTAEMTRLFHQMMEKARTLGQGSDGLVAELESEDPGKVLAAIAYAYELPGEATVTQLLHAISNSRQPFVQYWGLMALRKLTKVNGVKMWSAQDVANFRNLSLAFGEHTDRGWVHDQISKALEDLT